MQAPVDVVLKVIEYEKFDNDYTEAIQFLNKEE
jgi:hypothetical protein